MGDRAICARHNAAPAIGTNGTQGVRNGRGRSGARRRMRMTPRHTRTNASSVPMLTSWPRTSIGVSPATSAMIDAGDDRAEIRRPEPRMDRREDRRQQTVAAHREEDARLAQQRDEHRAEQSEERAHLDDRAEPLQARRVDADRQRIRDVQLADTARCRSSTIATSDVDHRADRERPENADRHVALRILRLLRRR